VEIYVHSPIHHHDVVYKQAQGQLYLAPLPHLWLTFGGRFLNALILRVFNGSSTDGLRGEGHFRCAQ
jgi:hypothetical protein